MSTSKVAKSSADLRVGSAVKIWQSAPALMVIQVMRAAGFVEADCQSQNKQQAVKKRELLAGMVTLDKDELEVVQLKLDAAKRRHMSSSRFSSSRRMINSRMCSWWSRRLVKI